MNGNKYEIWYYNNKDIIRTWETVSKYSSLKEFLFNLHNWEVEDLKDNSLISIIKIEKK